MRTDTKYLHQTIISRQLISLSPVVHYARVLSPKIVAFRKLRTWPKWIIETSPRNIVLPSLNWKLWLYSRPRKCLLYSHRILKAIWYKHISVSHRLNPASSILVCSISLHRLPACSRPQSHFFSCSDKSDLPCTPKRRRVPSRLFIHCGISN